MIVFVSSIVAACALHLRQYAAEVRSNVDRGLRALVEAKVGEVTSWREERISAGQAIAAHPLVARAAWLGQRGSEAARADLLAWCNSRLKRNEYSAVVVFGASGEVLAAAGAQAVNATSTPDLDLLRRDTKVSMSDLHRDAAGQLHIDVFAPLLMTDGAEPELAGHVVLRIDPEVHLVSTLHDWPERRRTGAVVLVQQPGEDETAPDVLTPGEAGARALFLSLPLQPADLVLARAARGEQGVLEGTEPRGARMRAVAAAVPGTRWSIVATMDEAEMVEPIRTRSAWLLALGTALAVAVIAVLMLWWRSHVEVFRRRQHEEELRRRALERHYAHLTSHGYDIVILLTGSLRIVEVNDRAVHAFGCERGELLGKHLREILAPEERAKVAATMQSITGGAVFETVHLRRDGTPFPVEVSARLIEVEGERYLQAVLRDVTERKRADLALRSSEERLQLVLETSGLGIWHWDARRDELHLSPSLLRMIGYAPEELRSVEEIRRIVHPDDRAATSEQWQSLLEGRVTRFEAEMRLRDRRGGWVRVLDRSQVITRDAAGAVVRLIGTWSDLTERKNVQA